MQGKAGAAAVKVGILHARHAHHQNRATHPFISFFHSYVSLKPCQSMHLILSESFPDVKQKKETALSSPGTQVIRANAS